MSLFPLFLTGKFDFDDIKEVAEKIGYTAAGLAIDTRVPPIDNTTVSKGRTIDLTYDGGYDIYFVFDASGSIPEAHFESALAFAIALVEKVNTNQVWIQDL